MEAHITPPPLPSDADPLTRLLAAILAFLRALLAAHQAAPLPACDVAPSGVAPIAPRNRTPASKSAKIRATPRHRRRRRQTTAQTAARAHAGLPARAPRPRDMTAGIPRPRLVAPH